MRKTYVQVWSDEAGRYVLVPKAEYRRPAERTHLVMPDLPEYESPVTGKPVDGRKQRREDLKRTGSRPYEKGEREDAARRRRDEWAALEQSVTLTVRDLMA